MIQVPAGLAVKTTHNPFYSIEIHYEGRVIGKVLWLEDGDRGYSFEVNFFEKPTKEVYEFFKSKCARSIQDHWKSRFPRPFDLSFNGYASLRLNGKLIYTGSLGNKPDFTIYESIEIQEETGIPGTDIVLEKGDFIFFAVR